MAYRRKRSFASRGRYRSGKRRKGRIMRALEPMRQRLGRRR